jgi:hypothetical protein
MNRQTFDTSKPTYKEHFDRLLDALLAYNADFENDYYNDIHIYKEDSFIILEWVKVPYSKEWGGNFKFVDEDEYVMKKVRFPDEHYTYAFPEDIEDILKNWHEKHPEWVKTDYGTWTNIEENRFFYIDNHLKAEFKNKDTQFEKVKLNNLLEELKKEKRLHRTDYIVCNKSTACALLTNPLSLKPENEENKNIYKYGLLKLQLDKQQWNKDEPIEYYDKELPIYVCDSIKDNEFALCLDNGYDWFYELVED